MGIPARNLGVAGETRIGGYGDTATASGLFRTECGGPACRYIRDYGMTMRRLSCAWYGGIGLTMERTAKGMMENGKCKILCLLTKHLRSIKRFFM